MKKSLSFLLVLLYACNNIDKGSTTSDNDIDAARNFIQAALNDDFDRAGTFMLDDSVNREDLALLRRLSRERLSDEDRKKYKEASIRIHERKPLNDSTSLIFFSNSYKNKKDSLRVVRYDKKWYVDLKYIFPHQIDSLPK